MALFVVFTAWAYTNSEKIDKNSPFVHSFSYKESQFFTAPVFKESYSGSKKAKLSVKKTGGLKQYYLMPTDSNSYDFPLSQGDGDYTVTLYESVGNTKNNEYTPIRKFSLQVELEDTMSPFLTSNYIVNFSGLESLKILSSDLYNRSVSVEDYIYNTYNYISSSMIYSQEKSDSLPFYYISDIPKVMEDGKGICNDYATAMTALLRLQGVPARIAVGEAPDKDRHAWVEVYLATDGFLAGSSGKRPSNWHLFDPTRFALEKQHGKSGFTMKELTEFRLESYN